MQVNGCCSPVPFEGVIACEVKKSRIKSMKYSRLKYAYYVVFVYEDGSQINRYMSEKEFNEHVKLLS